MSAKTNNFPEKSLTIVISSSLLLTPVLFSVKHFHFFTPIKYVFMAFFGSLCFALLSLYLLKCKLLVDKKLKVILGISAIMVAWLFISSFFGVDFQNSFWSNFSRHTGFLTYFFCWILFASSIFVFNKDNFLIPLKAMVIGGVLASISVYLSGALFSVNLNFLNNSSNAGTFGNTTYAGIFLIFSFFSSLIIFLKEENRRKKLLWAGCSLVILLSPIFLNTKGIFTGNIINIFSLVGEARAGLLSIFLGLLFSAVLYFYFNGRKLYSVLAKILLVVIFIAGICTTFSLLNENSKLHNYIINSGDGARFVYWDMAIIGITEKPFLGWGLENFSVIHKKYFNPILLSPQYPREPWVDKPHNNILEIAFSAGIPGLAFYLLLVGFVLLFLIKKASTVEKRDRAILSILFGLFISYLFQAFFAFDTVSSLQAFFVTSGVALMLCFGEVQYAGKRELNKYVEILTASVVVLLGMLMIYFFSFRVGQESKMIRKMNGVSIEERIPLFKKTMDLSPAGMMWTESHYIDLVLDKYKNNWSTYSMELKAGIKKELEYLFAYSQEKSDEHPSDFRFAYVTSKMGNMLFNISKAKQPDLINISKEYGMRSISNSPLNPLGYRVMAEVMVLEGDFDSAMKFAEMLVGLNKRVPEFYDLTIVIAKLKKDQKLVEEKIERARKFIPDY